MKQLIINASSDNCVVTSFDENLKPLSDVWETSLLLSIAIDRLIRSEHSKESIMEIIDEAYEIRLQMLNKKKN